MESRIIPRNHRFPALSCSGFSRYGLIALSVVSAHVTLRLTLRDTAAGERESESEGSGNGDLLKDAAGRTAMMKHRVSYSQQSCKGRGGDCVRMPQGPLWGRPTLAHYGYTPRVPQSDGSS